MLNNNPLLLTDVYKLSHAVMYPEDTEFVYSYLEARKPDTTQVFFGLQYILKQYLSRPITSENVEEFLEYYLDILGEPNEAFHVMKQKVTRLQQLGYWPLEIKAVPEGTVINSQNILLSVTNTIPGFGWCVGFVESLLLKVWYPISVATASFKYRQIVQSYADLTCDDYSHIPYAVHDFGYRSCSSEETAMIGGGAHLLNFSGSDTVSANKLLKEFYGAEGHDLGKSVPASEHSVMCSYGSENELQAFEEILDRFPEGIVSIVSDTYDLWNVLSNFTEKLKEKILSRPGKVVFRPDSGEPIDIICGNPFYENYAKDNYLVAAGALEILADKFGVTQNSKGYKLLNPKIGLIYGDGMYLERYERILCRMSDMRFASSNLVIGVGGIMLQNHSRDDFGFALKATSVVRSGKRFEIFKDPITDSGKKSKKGLMKLVKSKYGLYETLDCVSPEEEQSNQILQTVFVNGSVKPVTWNEVKNKLRSEISERNIELQVKIS